MCKLIVKYCVHKPRGPALVFKSDELGDDFLGLLFHTFILHINYLVYSHC